MKRPTIADVAKRAGVTKAAVSFALNDQPGVSAATRERILAIAAEVGFQPSSAARALSDGRAGAFGLVIDRPARLLGIEPYFMQLISGIQAELSGNRVTLLFTLAEDQNAEIALYRSWWAQRRVDGVFLVDLQLGDRRVPVLEKLNMPALVIGSPHASGSLPAVWQNIQAATEAAVSHLVGLGHRRIGRVTGIARYWHTKSRTDALNQIAAEAGIEIISIEADYTGEFGARATREMLSRPDPPTAIFYDNDVMAVAGMGEAQRMGLGVPADLSIMAWDDSMLCELVHPALTALRRDVAAVGSEAARRLSQMAAGGDVADFQEPPPALMVRASTAPPAPEPPGALAPLRRAGPDSLPTVVRAVAQLVKPAAGTIVLDGQPAGRRGRPLRAYRQQVALVFQDPFASLNPIHTVRHHLVRPLSLRPGAPRGAALEEEVRALLHSVNLTPPEEVAGKHPHELSGGQRQRVAIARALATDPDVLLADEPVSMLDVSIRLEILNLLDRLKRDRNLALLYVTHDLATARHFSAEIMVMYRGEIVERGRAMR